MSISVGGSVRLIKFSFITGGYAFQFCAVPFFFLLWPQTIIYCMSIYIKNNVMFCNSFIGDVLMILQLSWLWLCFIRFLFWFRLNQQFWPAGIIKGEESNAKDLSVNRDILSSGVQLNFGKLWMLLPELYGHQKEEQIPLKVLIIQRSFSKDSVWLALPDNRI